MSELVGSAEGGGGVGGLTCMVVTSADLLPLDNVLIHCGVVGLQEEGVAGRKASAAADSSGVAGLRAQFFQLALPDTSELAELGRSFFPLPALQFGLKGLQLELLAGRSDFPVS